MGAPQLVWIDPGDEPYEEPLEPDDSVEGGKTEHGSEGVAANGWDHDNAGEDFREPAKEFGG